MRAFLSIAVGLVFVGFAPRVNADVDACSLRPVVKAGAAGAVVGISMVPLAVLSGGFAAYGAGALYSIGQGAVRTAAAPGPPISRVAAGAFYLASAAVLSAAALVIPAALWSLAAGIGLRVASWFAPRVIEADSIVGIALAGAAASTVAPAVALTFLPLVEVSAGTHTMYWSGVATLVIAFPVTAALSALSLPLTLAGLAAVSRCVEEPPTRKHTLLRGYEEFEWE